MSEYWVSKKKYYCNYCEIYIADDAPSRQQHENGLRHKGSVERFVRGIYKTGEKQKKDRDEEMREMKRVEQVRYRSYTALYTKSHRPLSRLLLLHMHRTLARVSPSPLALSHPPPAP